MKRFAVFLMMLSGWQSARGATMPVTNFCVTNPSGIVVAVAKSLVAAQIVATRQMIDTKSQGLIAQICFADQLVGEHLREP